MAHTCRCNKELLSGESFCKDCVEKLTNEWWNSAIECLIHDIMSHNHNLSDDEKSKFVKLCKGVMLPEVNDDI